MNSTLMPSVCSHRLLSSLLSAVLRASFHRPKTLRWLQDVQVTVACMPSILFNAFSTCMRQWLHIMPSTLNSFFMIVSVGGSTSLFSSPSCILFRFSSRLLLTTLTLLNAMAAPAIIGFSRKPLMDRVFRPQWVHLLYYI